MNLLSLFLVTLAAAEFSCGDKPVDWLIIGEASKPIANVWDDFKDVANEIFQGKNALNSGSKDRTGVYFFGAGQGCQYESVSMTKASDFSLPKDTPPNLRLLAEMNGMNSFNGYSDMNGTSNIIPNEDKKNGVISLTIRDSFDTVVRVLTNKGRGDSERFIILLHSTSSSLIDSSKSHKIDASKCASQVSQLASAYDFTQAVKGAKFIDIQIGDGDFAAETDLLKHVDGSLVIKSKKGSKEDIKKIIEAAKSFCESITPTPTKPATTAATTPTASRIDYAPIIVLEETVN